MQAHLWTTYILTRQTRALCKLQASVPKAMASNKKSQEEKNEKKSPIEAAARAKSSSRKPPAKQKKEKEAPAAAATARAKSSGKRTPTKQQGERSQNNTNASSSSDSDAEEQKVIEISYTSGDLEDGEQSGDECEQRNNVENESKKSSKNNKGDKKRKGKSIEDDDDEDDCDGADGEGVSMFRFPMARIKRIMQCGDCHSKISQDAVFLVNKATEKFLEKFCEESYGCMVRDRRKAIDYRQLSAVVGKRRRFDFLSDFVPVKIKPNDALEERKQAAETAQG